MPPKRKTTKGAGTPEGTNALKGIGGAIGLFGALAALRLGVTL